MSAAYLAAVATRRTTYALTAKSSVSDEKIAEIIKHCVKHCPTPFNTQSSRAVLVIGAENTKLWDMVSESALKGMAEGALASICFTGLAFTCVRQGTRRSPRRANSKRLAEVTEASCFSRTRSANSQIAPG